MKQKHRQNWSFVLFIAVKFLAASLLFSCSESPDLDSKARMAAETTKWPLGGPDERRTRQSIPYSLADLGNTDVWTEIQGAGGPVSDNWMASIPQTRQSAQRKMKDAYGIAYHRGRIEAFVLDAAGNVIGYRIKAGDFTTPLGDYVAPCLFYAGLDSYMRFAYYDPIEGRTVFASGTVTTADGVRLPLFDVGDWVSVKVFDGRWWNGVHPDHDWFITGI